MKWPLSINTLLITLLAMILWFQSAAGQTNEGCAVSIDAWIVGEVCILGGLGIRSGTHQLAWELQKPELAPSNPVARFSVNAPLLPITLSTKPTKLSWIDLQFVIDFSLFNKVTDEESSIDLLSEIMTDRQIEQLKGLGIITDDSTNTHYIGSGYALDPAWSANAALSNQYVMLGLVFKAPWPYFLKPFVGIGIRNETFDIDIFLHNGTTKLTVFEGYHSTTEAVTIWGYEVINIEGFLFENSFLVFFKYTNVLYQPISIKGKNGIELDIDRTSNNLELISWSFTF